MVALIAALGTKNIIGNNNKLPWNIPEDLKHFKDLTNRHVVVMGRKTYESILGYRGKPLPNRTNVVITKNTEFKAMEGVEIYHAFQDAFGAHANEDIFVIGGAEIYKQAIELADKLYITHVQGSYEGDAFFPTIDPALWKEISREPHEGYSFVEYVRQ